MSTLRIFEKLWLSSFLLRKTHRAAAAMVAWALLLNTAYGSNARTLQSAQDTSSGLGELLRVDPAAEDSCISATDRGDAPILSLVQTRDCTLGGSEVLSIEMETPSVDDTGELYDMWDEAFSHENLSLDLSEYEWDGAGGGVVCSAGENGFIPGPYTSGDLIHRWYEPLRSNSALTAQDYPPAYDKRRKKALIIIHGWQGFDTTTFRQKRRLIHNAKENIVSAGSLLLNKRGIDLRFTYALGTPYGDDLGAMLQCMPPQDSTVALKTSSLEEFLTDKGVAGCQLHDSYQVGWWDWSAASFNRRLKDAEKSIWLPQAPHYIKDEHLLDLYKQIIADLTPQTQLTVVGNSLGASIALRLHRVVAEAAQQGKLSEDELLLSRVVLTDPYFSNNGPLPFDTSYWPGSKARSTLEAAELAWTELRLKSTNPEIKERFIAVDIYATPSDMTELFSDANRPLKFKSDMTVYVELDVGQAIAQELKLIRRRFPHPLLMAIDNWIAQRVAVAKRKHLYPLYWTLDTLARSTIPTLCGSQKEHASGYIKESQEVASKSRDSTRSLSPASTVKDISQVWRSGQARAWYYQKEGGDTIKPEDDVFCYHLP